MGEAMARLHIPTAKVSMYHVFDDGYRYDQAG